MEAQLTPEQIKLINIIEDNFTREIGEEPPVQLSTTAQIFAKLQSLYPSEAYTPEDVYLVLQYLKFDTIDSSEGVIKWLMAERK